MTRFESTDKNVAQRFLTKQGTRAVGSKEASRMSPTEVRRAGFGRIGRIIGSLALAASSLWLAKGVADAVKGPEVPDLSPGAPNTEVYTVQPGDTRWDIATRFGNGDPRPLVDELGQQPDAQDGLQGGDRLTVPAQEENSDQNAG